MFNIIFFCFDELIQKYGLEKIKIIGDVYMVVFGLLDVCEDYVEVLVDMVFGMIDVIEDFVGEIDLFVCICIGINFGIVVVGVIGKKKFIYDLWGDMVNVVSWMEFFGEMGMIQVIEVSYDRLKYVFVLEKCGMIEVKGCGLMIIYILKGCRLQGVGMVDWMECLKKK